MLKMTFQTHCDWLGKARKAGDVVTDELAQALAENRTTMTSVNAMKNQKLIILQTEDEENIDRSLTLNSASLHEKLDAIIAHFRIEMPAKVDAEPKTRSRRKAA